MTRAILIAGPTASGKSRLALRSAEQLGGIVINADSMQVYSELRVLTARPTPAEEARVRMRSTASWPGRKPIPPAATQAMPRAPWPRRGGGARAYRRRWHRPLLQGAARGPLPGAAGRCRRARLLARAGGAEACVGAACHARSERPETAARLMPTDPQRIVRALEVFESTGRSLANGSSSRAARCWRKPIPCGCWCCRSGRRRWRRIDARFEAMLAAGALEEVRALLALGLSRELPVMRALGVVPWPRTWRATPRSRRRWRVRRRNAANTPSGNGRGYRRNIISWKAINAQQMQRIAAGDLSFIES